MSFKLWLWQTNLQADLFSENKVLAVKTKLCGITGQPPSYPVFDDDTKFHRAENLYGCEPDPLCCSSPQSSCVFLRIIEPTVQKIEQTGKAMKQRCQNSEQFLRAEMTKNGAQSYQASLDLECQYPRKY